MVIGSGCPEIEEIAAFIDDRLNAAERSRVTAHLAECADCRELVAETSRVTADLASQDALRRGGRRRPLAIAAAVALVAITGAILYRGVVANAPPEVRVGDLVGQLRGHPGLAQEIWRWPAPRGREAPSALSRQSFRLGSLIVDLEVALEAADAGRAADSLRTLAALLEDAGLMRREAELARAAAGEAERAGVTADLRGRLSGLEASLDERFLPTELAFGKWCEAARLAAAAAEPAFFADRDHRRVAAWLAESGDLLDREAAAQLAAVAASWDGELLSPPAYAQLERALARILERYAR